MVCVGCHQWLFSAWTQKITQWFWSYFLHKSLNGKLNQCNGLVEKPQICPLWWKTAFFHQRCQRKTETNSVCHKVHIPFGLCGEARFSLSVGKTGSMEQTLQKPPQHTLAPTGKTHWFGNSSSASTWLSSCVYLSITVFKSLLKARTQGSEETQWGTCTCVLLPEPRRRVHAGVTHTAAGLAAGQRTHTPATPAPD